MRRKNEAAWFGLGFFLGGLLLVGCGGTSETVNLDIHSIGPDSKADQPEREGERLIVLLEPIEDARPEKGHVGVRKHLGGGVTTFDVGGGTAGDVVANVIADYLKERGWTVERDRPGGRPQGEKPDVIITGEVLEFAADAESWFFHTTMNASVKVALKSKNTADGSVTGINMEGAREQTVFWFDAEDLQRLVSLMLRDSVQSAMGSLRVSQGRLGRS